MCLPVEPYRIEREWVSSGLQCAVVQAREASHRCGYVRVPPTHPLFGKDYDEPDVDVHGGLTFARLEPCTEHLDGQGWWFGFDCAHCGDALHDPAIEIAGPEFFRGGHYWTEAEVIEETNRLADQLNELAALPN